MTQQTTNDLKALLKKDLANLEQLHKVLQGEHEALRNNNALDLEQAATEKDRLLKAIRERAKTKIRLLVNLGYHPDSGETPSDFLQKKTGDQVLIELWRNAQSQLETCQRTNAVNGRIINHMQRRLTRISDIIRGADRNQSLYGKAGETQSLTHSSVLASA